MRNISFSLTESQLLDGSKDVTRRLGWGYLRAGDILMACRKCRGIKRGEKIARLAPIQVVSVRRERLDMMICGRYGKSEAAREGFPHLDGLGFVTMFCREMKCHPDKIITRIEFTLGIPEPD